MQKPWNKLIFCSGIARPRILVGHKYGKWSLVALNLITLLGPGFTRPTPVYATDFLRWVDNLTVNYYSYSSIKKVCTMTISVPKPS